MTKYIQRYDGEVQVTEKEKLILVDEDGKKKSVKGYHIKTCCCDCSLVHNVYLWTEKGKLHEVLFRDKRATGQRRRYNNFIKE
jgi:hypothetical protein